LHTGLATLIPYLARTYEGFIKTSIGLLHNVPNLTDVFLRPRRKNAKHFYGRKKMWRSKISQRGVAPTGILRSLAAVRRRTVTDLLGDVIFALLNF